MIPGGITGIFLKTIAAFTLCKALGGRLYRNWACFYSASWGPYSCKACHYGIPLKCHFNRNQHKRWMVANNVAKHIHTFFFHLYWNSQKKKKRGDWSTRINEHCLKGCDKVKAIHWLKPKFHPRIATMHGKQASCRKFVQASSSVCDETSARSSYQTCSTKWLKLTFFKS